MSRKPYSKEVKTNFSLRMEPRLKKKLIKKFGSLQAAWNKALAEYFRLK